MSITSANSVLTLGVAALGIIPQNIQGFATDDIYDIPSIRSVEVMMGVDGVLSAGFVFTAIPQTIVLMADSSSNAFFDALWTQMQAARETYAIEGSIRLPGIATKFTQTNGYLTGYQPSPAAKKVLQPRRFEITWNKVAPSPI